MMRVRIIAKGRATTTVAAVESLETGAVLWTREGPTQEAIAAAHHWALGHGFVVQWLEQQPANDAR